MNLSDVLTTAYNLPPLLTIETAAPHLYHVVSEAGRYRLTILPAETALAKHYYHHWLLVALSHARLSFRIPVPLRDKSGSTFYHHPNGEKWVIVPQFTGEPITPNDADSAYCMGAALGELHVALSQIHPMPHPHSDYHLHHRILPNLHKPFPRSSFELGLSASKESKHRFRRFVTLAEMYRDALPMPHEQDLHWHIIHGAFYGHNLCYDGDCVVSVLEFGEAHPDYRALEFANALLWVANDLGTLFWGTARAFVEGYAGFARLTRAEIELIPRLMVASQVDKVLSFVGNNYEQATAALRTYEDISAWLESEQPRLSAMLRGVFLGE